MGYWLSDRQHCSLSRVRSSRSEDHSYTRDSASTALWTQSGFDSDCECMCRYGGICCKFDMSFRRGILLIGFAVPLYAATLLPSGASRFCHQSRRASSDSVSGNPYWRPHLRRRHVSMGEIDTAGSLRCTAIDLWEWSCYFSIFL